MGRLRPLVLEGRSGYVTGMSNKWLTSAWEHQEPRYSMLFLLLPQQSLKSHVEMWCCGWSSGNPQVVTLQILLSHTGFEFGGLFVIAAQPNLSWLILSVMNQLTSWSWVCLICLWELVSPNLHCWDNSDSQPLYHQRKKEWGTELRSEDVRHGPACDKQAWRPVRYHLSRRAQDLRGSDHCNPESLPGLWPEEFQDRGEKWLMFLASPCAMSC